MKSNEVKIFRKKKEKEAMAESPISIRSSPAAFIETAAS